MTLRLLLRRLAGPPAIVALTTASAFAVGALRDDPSGAPTFTLDPSAPLFAAHNAANLLPGQHTAACATIANSGHGRGRVALYAPAIRGDLARHLQLTVTRGRRGQAPSGSCTSFSADSTEYGLEDPGVLFRGRLADFPTSSAAALLDPSEWPAGAEHSFRFALELTDDPASEGLSATWDWRLAVESLDSSAPGAARDGSASSSSTTAPRCERVQLAGAVRARRHRTILKRIRINRRVGGVLAMRVFGDAGAQRVVLTTGLRVHRKTLLIPRWARVSYTVNRGRPRRAHRRPFRVRVPARTLRQGTNRIAVKVVPPRGRGRTRRRVFGLRSTAARLGGRPVCVVSP